MLRSFLALKGRLEIAQQFALLRRQVDRRFDHDAAKQIARRVAAHGLDALAAQAEEFSGLRLQRHLDQRGLPSLGLGTRQIALTSPPHIGTIQEKFISIIQ